MKYLRHWCRNLCHVVLFPATIVYIGGMIIVTILSLGVYDIFEHSPIAIHEWLDKKFNV